MVKMKDLFRDRNDVNEKVIVGYISFCIMIVFAVLDIVSSYLGKELLVHQFIFDSFLYLTLGAFGISSVDKYTNKRNSDSDRHEYNDGRNDEPTNSEINDSMDLPSNNPANENDPNR